MGTCLYSPGRAPADPVNLARTVDSGALEVFSDSRRSLARSLLAVCRAASRPASAFTEVLSESHTRARVELHAPFGPE